MLGRYAQLEETLAGRERTNIPLIAYDGQKYLPAGFSDDPGLFFLVPWLVLALKLNLKDAVDLFLAGVALVSFGVGLIGLWLVLKGLVSRVVATIGLAGLLWLTLWIGDVYLIQSACVVAVVPWFLYMDQHARSGVCFYPFLAGTGFIAGVANFIRSQAGTAVLVFIVVRVLLDGSRSLKQKILIPAVLLSGLLVPVVYSHILLTDRGKYLTEVQPDWVRVAGQHPFWHPIYVGFGFLSNEYVPAYSDKYAAAKVRELAPQAQYLSKEYEQALRTAVFQLIRKHPQLAIMTVFAKLGVILGMLVLFANAGLLVIFWYPKDLALESAFWAAMAFNSLVGILVVPHLPYLLGFIAFAVVYGIVSIGHAIERCRSGEVRGWFRWHLVRILCAA